jgi:hypothetical protein
MKSAYELAMERLNKQSPTVKLTAAQKEEIAEAERVTKAKIAELDLARQEDMDKAADQTDIPKMGEIEQHFLAEKQKLETKLEEKKEAIRRAAGK